MANDANGTPAPAARGQWASRWGFILAAAGSAVGLGNIWKFPYITGENGGGFFVLIYLVCIALVGLPIMVAEIMIGRAARAQPVAAFHTLQGKHTPWAWVGRLGVLTGFVILSYYVVVAGWAMQYTMRSVTGFTDGINRESDAEAANYSAGTDLETMRQTLIERRLEKDLAPEAAYLRSQAKPSVWRAHNAFQEQVDAGKSRDALLRDPVLAERVAIAEEIEREIDAARADLRPEIVTYYEELPDDRLTDEAVLVVRREAIADRIENAFLEDSLRHGWKSILWATLFMLITIGIVVQGISRGIERACKILMPTLAAIIGVMVVYGCLQPGFEQAFAFVFQPDASKLEASGVLEALGHAFFTLSLGMGAMITYGSYQASKRGLAAESITISALDTGVALAACLMMFPILFSYDQSPGAGPGLVFVSMPLAFAQMGGAGTVLSVLFFGLLVFAALTSSISLLEVVSSYLIDEQGWSRARSTWLVGGITFLFSVPAAFAASGLGAAKWWEETFTKNYFDTVDYLASNWMLPLGGLFIALYAGWVMPRRMRDAELEGLAPALVHGWVWLVRVVAPVLVFVVFLQKIGVLDLDELLGGRGP